MRKFLFYILLMLACCGSWAQQKEVMMAYQNEIQPLLEKVYTAPTDNERYNANETVVQLMHEALMQEGSFHFKFDFGKRMSILASSDRQFRIFSWPVVKDNGEFECFGFVQSWNEKTESYDVYVLSDKSDETPTPEESVCFPESWYGCVYQELIETKYEGRIFYTLLGWTGVDNLRQRKVMEPIFFRPSSSKPQFGAPVFRKVKNQRRKVLLYSSSAMVNLHYDEQYCQVVENKKSKKKGRTVNEQVSHNEKFNMVIFDELEPQMPGMEGLFQYYLPTGTEMAYIFVNGKWELHDGAQGRLADPKLNKEFAPLPKSAPRYQVSYGSDED